MDYIDFRGAPVSRVIKGNWQLSGGHGTINIHEAIDDLFQYVDAGITAFDVGDIYTGAEEILGTFLKRYRAIHGASKFEKLRVHTKFVPDLDALPDLDKKDIRFIIERSLTRLGVDQLHLVQFHWWDFAQGDFVAAAQYLQELKQEGLINQIGVTNFDQKHLQKLLDAGVDIASNQIQFSLLDPRPLNGMLEFAAQHKIAIFCYGVLAGGLLGNRNPIYDPTNRSHNKYRLIIDEVGHDYYDEVLATVVSLADKYQTSVGNISAAFVLQTDNVSAAILGPRNLTHLEEIKRLFEFKLAAKDHDLLMKALKGRLKRVNGDIYSYERNREGAHGKIMKYNLNGMRIK